MGGAVSVSSQPSGLCIFNSCMLLIPQSDLVIPKAIDRQPESYPIGFRAGLKAIQ